MDEVIASLNSKGWKKTSGSKEEVGDGLYVRGRSESKGSRSGNQSSSQSKGPQRRCFVCNSDKNFKILSRVGEEEEEEER